MLVFRRTAYLLMTLPLGIVWFTVISTLVSTGIGLAITLIGIPILVGTVYVLRWMAQAERGLVRGMLGVDAAAHYRTTTDPDWWPGFQARLADPQTWKDLVYLVVQLPIGVVWFTLTTVLISVPVLLLGAPVYFYAVPDGLDVGVWTIDTIGGAIGLMLLGLPIAWLSLRAIDGLAWLHGQWATFLLASSPPDPLLTAQVVDARSAQARIIEAADAERRRIERDLHDGAQQRLVSLSLKLGMAQSRLPEDDETAAKLIAEAHQESRLALTELRDLARGIHPAILTDRGLGPALDDLAGRATTPVRIAAIPPSRLPAPVEAGAYFVVAECLANVDKYAEAQAATVTVIRGADALEVDVADDGKGGADPATGSGLRGLADRLGALGGRLDVTSPEGEGTRVHATIPLATTDPVAG
ncbi:MAG: sensor histidine kinase [Baekduiaceae bacterium]